MQPPGVARWREVEGREGKREKRATWFSKNLTALVFKSSSRKVSRWCNRLNRLILSWSSRRTSRSSWPIDASSSLESCERIIRVIEFRTMHPFLSKGKSRTIRRCIIVAGWLPRNSPRSVEESWWSEKPYHTGIGSDTERLSDRRGDICTGTWDK